MPTVLGLTGGIASGKSTIANVFKERKIPIVDADIVAREVMRAGQPVVQEIAETFGPDYLLENGEINRKKLGNTIFAKPDKRRTLNQIVQEEIRKEIERQRETLLEEGHPLIVLDIPLLYEGSYEYMVDIVMVTYVDKETQYERLRKRNKELSKEDVKNRVASQMPLVEKAKRADILINNNGTLEETVAQVKAWLDENFPELKEK